MIDFTNCKRIISRAYNGANGKKIAVEYNGEDKIQELHLPVYHCLCAMLEEETF